MEGAPWSPRFRKDIFDPAGLSMNNKANIVPVVGHRGPHPFEYHTRIYAELLEAVGPKRSESHQAGGAGGKLAELGEQIKRA